MIADPHCHTVASDGMVGPAELVKAAVDAHLDLIAVTDHDTMDSVNEAQAHGESAGIVVVAGQEVTTKWPSQTHLMGWFLDRPVKRGMSVEDYIKLGGPMIEKQGFSEREIARKADQFGNIVQVFSTYESRVLASDPKPFARGINSFQLWNDGTRWWIVTILWQEEDPSNPLPSQYLPGGH